jgi:hypothetical protein
MLFDSLLRYLLRTTNKYCQGTCEKAAENGGSGGCFRRPFHRTPTRGPRRFRLLYQALTSLLQPLSLLHSFAMPTIHISLCRRCAVPTSPMLRFAPLLPRYHARIPLRIPLVVSRLSSTTPSSSTLVVSGELETFPLCISDFREIRQPGLAYFDRTKYIPSFKRRQQMFSSFAAPGDSESRSTSRCCDTSMDSSSATNTTRFSRYVDVECS